MLNEGSPIFAHLFVLRQHLSVLDANSCTCFFGMRFPLNLSSSMLTSWSLRIKESSAIGIWQDVFSYYREMKRSGVQPPDPSVFPPILKACLRMSSGYGKSIHACLIKQGYDSFASIGNSIMDFYMKCGDLESAAGAFFSMENIDSVSWNVMIYGHLDHGALREGLGWFAKARVAGFDPNTSTLVLVVQACRSVALYREGEKIHGYIIRSGSCGSHSVQNSLLCMYADTAMGSARRLFDEMCEKDVISWSVMITGYANKKEAQVGVQLFREMLSNAAIPPDGITTASVLKACTNLVDIHLGKSVHGIVISRGFSDDLFIGNSLIDMYSKCNDVSSASGVFSEMPQKNKISWNSLLSGFVFNEQYSEALSLFGSMGKEGFEEDEVTLVNLIQTLKYFLLPVQCKSVHCVIIRRGYQLNELILNTLLDAYAKCGLYDLACKLFDGLERKDVVSWSIMIAGLTHCGNPDEAISFFHKMSKAKEKPNAITIINILEACSVSAELKRAKWAHGISIRRGLAADVSVGTAIVGMYSKCGAIEASRKAFDQIPQKNIVSWSALVSAYGMNGLPREALQLVKEMRLHGLKPNAVTFLSALSACSHGGLVKEGLSFFRSMVQDHRIVPGLEHYSCVVDMLCRAGMLDSAMELINKMPDSLKAGASAWGAILSACRSYGYSEIGAGALAHVLELEPLKSAGYLLASTMYAAYSSWDNVTRVRMLVKERGLRVAAGYSSVHVDNKAFRFVAGDCSNPQAGYINIMVEKLHSCMSINEMNDLDILVEC